jgi:hypothetical protein
MDPTTALCVRQLPGLPVEAPGAFDGRTVWLRPGLEYVEAYATVRALLPDADACLVLALTDQAVGPS